MKRDSTNKSAGFLFCAAVLGDNAFEGVVVPTGTPESNRVRCAMKALDLMRRLAQGLEQPVDEELRELDAMAQSLAGDGELGELGDESAEESVAESAAEDSEDSEDSGDELPSESAESDPTL